MSSASCGSSGSISETRSERRRMKPTCGPLPWVRTIRQPRSTSARSWTARRWAAANCSAIVAGPPPSSRAFPPTATTAVRAVLSIAGTVGRERCAVMSCPCQNPARDVGSCCYRPATMSAAGTGVAGTTEAAITVEEALRLDCLREARVLAGHDGLGRPIRGVNVMEDADIVRWMRGGELLLTTGYTIRDDPAALARLVPALAERDLAGLVVKVGLYIDTVSDEVLAGADRLAFPVVRPPP